MKKSVLQYQSLSKSKGKFSLFRFIGLSVMCLFLGTNSVMSQVSITTSSTYFQDFTIGTSGTASLPTGFKFGNNTADWTAAGNTTATTLAYGNTGSGAVTSSSSGGAINWANGITGSATERAIGFLTAGAYTSPRDIFFAFTNNTGSTITALDLHFDYEKYRSGSRAFDWTFFHGGTNTSVNTSATAGDQSYAADANNTVISNPAVTISKSVSLTGLSITNGSTYYFRWRYTGNGGSTNGQGIGIDNVTLVFPQSLPYSQNFGTSASFTTYPAGFHGRAQDGSATASQATALATTPSGSLIGLTAQAGAIASEPTGGLLGYGLSSNGELAIATSSSTTSGLNQPFLTINTGSLTSVNVSYDIEVLYSASGYRTMGIELEYRAGTTGSWTSVSGSSVTFTAGGSTPILNSVTSKSSLSITGLSTSTNYQLRWASWRDNSSGSTNLTVGLDNVSITNSSSSSSNIILNSSFTHPTNIDYSAYQTASTLTSGNSIEVGQFDIQDGGGSSDADALSTTLTAISFTVANFSNIRTLAIFDGSTNVGELTSVTATSSFSGLTLAPSDNGSKTFSLRATFKSSVTDNQQISFTVSSATASGAGSGFSAANAGAAATSTSGDNNKIEVATTDIIFDQNVSHVAQNSVMNPSPTVRAIDANVNYDLDNTSNVVLTISSGSTTFGGAATTTVAMVAGVATLNNLVFSTASNTNQLTATQGSFTDLSNSFNVTSAAPEINVKQNVTSIVSGSGTYAAGSIVSGNSGSATTFTIENLGTLDLTYSSITSSNTTDFTLNTASASSPITPSNTTTFTVTFNPTTAGAKTTIITIINNDTDEGTYTFTVTGSGTVSVASDITNTAGYTYTSNVDYAAKQTSSTLTLANSVGVNGLTLRDGGVTTDADNLATTLTDITFSTGGSTAIRTAALFDGSSNIAEIAVNGGTSITFSGLTLSTSTDGGTKDFELRVTYQSTVTDNQQLTFTVSSATSTATLSGFASASAGAAASSTSVDVNRLEVTATALAFVAQPANTTSNVAMTDVTVSANDGNGNRDLDFTSSIRITSTGTLTGSPIDVAASSGLATFAGLTHTVTGTTLTLNAERTSTLDWDVTSSSFDINAGPASYIYRSLRTGNWNGVTSGSETWERSANGGSTYATVTLSADLPSSSNSTITIQNGHTVTVSATATVDEVVVQSGGILIVSAAMTVNNGTGDDISIESGGRVNYTVSTFTYTASSNIRIKTGGILSVESTGLTANNAGVNASTHVYETGGILLYNLSSSPSTSGVTYFPNVTTEIPIFRFGQTIASLGAGTQTTFNGRVELASGVTLGWTGNSTKTFKYGIVGLGGTNAMTASGTGVWSITGTSAQLGTNGGTSLTLTNTNGITISSSTSATLVGNLNLGASTNLTVAASGGILDAANNQLIASGASATFTINGILKTSKTEGFSGSTSTTISTSNTPTITLGSGSTIEYTSASAQTVTPRAYVNITISGAGMKSVSAGGQITFSGTLTTAGLLTLKSDNTGTASIGSSGSITGNVTVERYIPSATSGRKYRNLAAPFSSGPTIASSWQQQIYITGSGSGGTACPSLTAHSNGFDASTNNNGSMLTFNEATATPVATTPNISGATVYTNAWTSIPNTGSTNLTAGTGYNVYIRGNRSQGCGLLDGTNNTPIDVTLSASGTVKTGDHTFAVTYNALNGDGWNLVGNPYPCAIDWDQASWTKTNVLGTTWIFDPANDRYATYVTGSGGTNGGTNIIASGQAFFVKANAASPILSVTEAAKTNSAASNMFKGNKPFEIRLTLSNSNSKSDEHLIIFNRNKTDLFDEDADAEKMGNASGVNIYSYDVNNKKYAINTLANIEDNSEKELPLGLGSATQGNYTIKVESLSLPNFYQVFLLDKYTHTETQLLNGEPLIKSFNVTSDTASFGNNRFSIWISNNRPHSTGLSSEEFIEPSISVYPNPTNTSISINTNSKSSSTLKLIDLMGKEILAIENPKAIEQIDLSNFQSGVYILQIENKNKLVKTTKVIKN
ncbi:MAG: hypothetical protein CFE21_06530 [Bacteroidetes bacterium B1(2017)]|nr:MAG: hypothetical protein CFE21_06530 [Bacteroidetes bacterium B1(2017)]